MRYLIMLVFAIMAGISPAPGQGRFLQETSTLMTDAMGQPFYPQQKYNWEGKVFFPDEYTLATITTSNGKSYRNIKAKLNLFDNTILFTDSVQREFVVSMPVAKIEFENIIGEKTFTFIKPSEDTGTAFFQVLDSGKVSLLKKIFLTYKDQTGFGSTSVTRIFEQKHSYHTFHKNMLQSLVRSKADILALMPDKTREVDTFIEQQNLKLRREEDLVKVFRFYNNL